MQIFISYSTLKFYSKFWNFLNIYQRIIGIIIYFLYELSYTFTSLMDPGIITNEYYLENFDVDKMNLNKY